MVESYGAFDVSLVTDLPLFVDPFLLFNSENPRYRGLHDDIIKYVRFLKGKAQEGRVSPGDLAAWFTFPEVKQNWFGFTLASNEGHGLGRRFAQALGENLTTVFRDFGEEQISRSSHLEKLCLIRSGVGRDNISDFTTNLIKGFLLEYTQEFARAHIDPRLCRRVPVRNVRFDYNTETWATGEFFLPWFRDDYVLLTPKNILTKDESWISRRGLVADFDRLIGSVPNEQLRAQLNNYFYRVLPPDPTGVDLVDAVDTTVREFPAVLDYYIRDREDRQEEAISFSDAKVTGAERLFVTQVRHLITARLLPSGFYELPENSYDEAMNRPGFCGDHFG